MNKITKRLLELVDEKNADFQAKLAPTISRDTFLGIKIPKLRMVEKEFRGTKDASDFLKELPHRYYDENMIHSVFLSNIKDEDELYEKLEEFLPYIDNWGVCDTLRPKLFKKKKDVLIEKIKEWSASDEPYICRCGIGFLMAYFLDDDFKKDYLEIPARVVSEEYYVNMMIAWYFATALAKQWDATVPYIEDKRLPQWVHNKTIQKAIESFRVTDEHKKYLRSLKY